MRHILSRLLTGTASGVSASALGIGVVIRNQAELHQHPVPDTGWLGAACAAVTLGLVAATNLTHLGVARDLCHEFRRRRRRDLGPLEDDVALDREAHRLALRAVVVPIVVENVALGLLVLATGLGRAVPVRTPLALAGFLGYLFAALAMALVRDRYQPLVIDGAEWLRNARIRGYSGGQLIEAVNDVAPGTKDANESQLPGHISRFGQRLIYGVGVYATTIVISVATAPHNERAQLDLLHVDIGSAQTVSTSGQQAVQQGVERDHEHGLVVDRP
jgi:hypothetical protein